MTDNRPQSARRSGGNDGVIAILAIHLLGKDIGTGGDRVLVEMAKRWKRSGRDVVVIAPATAPLSLQSQTGASMRFVGTTFFDRNPGLFAIPFTFFFRAIRGIPIVARVNAGTIYSGGDFICNIVPGVWAKLRSPDSPKLAVSIHHVNASPFARHGNSIIASTVSYLLQRLSFLLIKRHANIVFVLSAAMKEWLSRHGFDPRRTVVTGAGVDISGIDRAVAPAAPRFDACFVGRLNPTKGIFDLPAIWRGVVDQIPNARLLVMGGGEEWRDEFNSQIARHGLERHITVAGFVPESDYFASMKSCRVFIAPSYEEGFGISLCEGMACGLPAVAYTLPVYRELFGDGPTFVPAGDTAAMAREITKLLTVRRYYEHRSAAARKSAVRHDWQRVADIALTAIDSADSPAR